MHSNSPIWRHSQNPIITPEQMPCECYSVFNAGAIIIDDKINLLLRVENFERKTNFYRAISSDGYNFDIDSEPINYPLREVEKKWGTHRFDMRITCIEDRYIVCHALYLDNLGSCIGIAETRDFKDFFPIGEVSVPSNRNAVIFPEKINGLYCRLERPQNIDGSGRIWVSYSPDLIFWGKSQPLDIPVTFWQLRKNGAGTVPVKTDKGWLEIYHGTVMTASTENYYLGALLLDLDDPSKVIAAPEKYILAPEKPYECMGQVPNVVFTGGAVVDNDGKMLIYYGGADTCMCVAESSVDKLLNFCLNS